MSTTYYKWTRKTWGKRRKAEELRQDKTMISFPDAQAKNQGLSLMPFFPAHLTSNPSISLSHFQNSSRIQLLPTTSAAAAEHKPPLPRAQAAVRISRPILRPYPRPSRLRPHCSQRPCRTHSPGPPVSPRMGPRAPATANRQNPM